MHLNSVVDPSAEPRDNQGMCGENTPDGMKNLLEQIRAFVKQRNWSRYHSPKNLSMALSVETAELAEIFQWLTEDESRNLTPEQKTHAAEEVGDVLIYLVNLADRLGIEPLAAAFDKMEKNALKYPVEKTRGPGLDRRN